MAQRGGKRAGAGRPKGRRELRTAVQAAARNEVEVFTARRVLEEIAALAFSDVGDLYDDVGRMRAMRDMPAAARRALSSAKTSIYNEPGARDGVQEHVREVKLWSKPEALKLAAQFHGLLIEATADVTDDQAIRARMRRGEERARAAQK